VFKLIVITIGGVYAFKQLILPFLSQNIEDKKHCLEFEKLKNQVKSEFEFLKNYDYKISITEDLADKLYIEYFNSEIDRKFRIKLDNIHRKLEIDLIDRDFFPINIIHVFKDTDINFEWNHVTTNAQNDIQFTLKQITGILRNEFKTVQNYRSFRNFEYYTNMLKKIMLNDSEDYKINWIDAVYASHLTKMYSEMCIKEKNIEFAELALILNAIVPVFDDYRELAPKLTLIYVAIQEIGTDDARNLFAQYAMKKYNKNSKIFQSYVKADKSKITAESMGYTLIKYPIIEFQSKYHRKLSTFDKWQY